MELDKIPLNDIALHKPAIDKMRSNGKSIEEINKCIQIINMRKKFMTYDAIAAELEISPKDAYEIAHKYLELSKRESIELQKQLEIERFEALESMLYEEALDKKNLFAVDRIVKISERKGKIQGEEDKSKIDLNIVFKDTMHDTI